MAAALAAAALAPAPADPLAADIDRGAAYLRTHDTDAKDELWADLKGYLTPAATKTEQALREGRRLLALQRLASWRPQLTAYQYVEGLSAERKETAAFEAAWTREGPTLGKEAPERAAAQVATLRPAAVRALAEAAQPQIRGYYEASLEYGRNTMPESGVFYIGSARGQRDFIELCATLREPADRPAPALRSISGEIDALEKEILAAYRPPASIDRHSEFIGVSATLNEARELDEAGLRFGALLRYLQAALRFAALRPAPAAAPSAADLDQKLTGLDGRLRAGASDDTIGRIFLQSAQSEVAAASSGGNLASAAAIANDVLPRYFATLEPARPAAPAPAPAVTVTLVRWPYT